MRRLRLGIIGYGRVGSACAEGILAADDLTLAGIVRRPETAHRELPDSLRDVRIATDAGELGDVDAALVCLPPSLVRDVVLRLLAHRTPTVECAALHGSEFQEHRQEIHRIAARHRTPAVVGAGWDPGVLSVFRELFALLAPHGHSRVHHEVGRSLHHTLVASAVSGVRDALCTEMGKPDGTRQRYVYVELEPGADPDRVAEAIRADPLFLADETLVFPVASVGEIEDEGRGLVLERWGASATIRHQRFLLEARYEQRAVAAQVMLSAARAIPALAAGAHTLLDVPLGALWGLHGSRAGTLEEA